MPVILEVNDKGEILVPAELVRAAPHTRVTVSLKPLTPKPTRASGRLVDSLPKLSGHLAEPALTYRREDLYGADGR